VALTLDATIIVSGGQPWIRDLAAANDVGVIGETTGTFRIDGRFAPHNLYGSTPDLRATADSRGFGNEPPRPWLPFGDRMPGGGDAISITIEWSGSQTVEWRYDHESGIYLRWANGVEHSWIDAEGATGQIAADVLVVLMTNWYVASGDEGSPVPAVKTTGSGEALVFAGGTVWAGIWQRGSTADPFEFFDEDGNPATVPAGRLWVSLVPAGHPVTVE
jgi:hypothetical protein